MPTKATKRKGQRNAVASNRVTQKERDFAVRINKLHLKFESNFKNTLEIAAQIGQLLLQKKSELKHGQWIPWVDSNLNFTDRTASNYIRIFKNKEKLSLENCDGVFRSIITASRFW